MQNKLVIFAAFTTLAIVNGARLSSHQDTNIASILDKEARILEVPTLGAILFKGAKTAFFLLKSAWALVGFKVGAIALIANLAIWAFKHSFKIVIGAVAMFGFCKLSGKCSLDHVPKGIIQVGDSLLYAARHLENGAAMYNNDVY